MDTHANSNVLNKSVGLNKRTCFRSLLSQVANKWDIFFTNFNGGNLVNDRKGTGSPCLVCLLGPGDNHTM